MKRIYLILLLVIGMGHANAQNFGATPLDVKGTYDGTKPVYDVWLKQGQSNATMKFNETVNGIDNAFTETERLLLQNGRSRDDFDIYKSTEGSDLEGDKKNPQVLHNSIQKGKTKINLSWNLKDGSILQLFLAKDAYEINIFHAYK
jgi:hypothetical protein